MFKIGDIPVGAGHPTVIVAELGGTHNADLQTALKMMHMAFDAGATLVKFQKRTPRLCVPEDQWDKPKSTPWGDMSYIEYREKMEFGLGEYLEIDAFSKQLGIPWFASAWDIPSVDFLIGLDVPCIKVPSACLTDDALLGYIKEESRVPTMLSTGMSTEEEIHHAISIFGGNIVLLHCTSTYPCPLDELNLDMIRTLTWEYPDCAIGYSGHEAGLATTVAAVALGASIVERHFTLDRTMWGTDHAASVEPGGFRRLVKDIRNVERAMGDGVKKVYPSEMESMKKLRKVAYGRSRTA